MGEGDIRKAFDSLDLEHNRTIEYTQFVAAALSERIFRDEERMIQAFHRMDYDDDGKITKVLYLCKDAYYYCY